MKNAILKIAEEANKSSSQDKVPYLSQETSYIFWETVGVPSFWNIETNLLPKVK